MVEMFGGEAGDVFHVQMHGLRYMLEKPKEGKKTFPQI